VVSAARPKIADYPFTTLAPMLGVVRHTGESTFTIADIPGLIQGAHENKGLGHQFLRHIQRTKVLVFLLDASRPVGRSMARDLEVLMEELRLYDAALLYTSRGAFAEYDVLVAALPGLLPSAYIERADLLIIGGTSLSVYPAAGFVEGYRGDLVIINRSPTPMDRRATLCISAPIGKTLAAAMELLDRDEM
jgi:hypothetical protein